MVIGNDFFPPFSEKELARRREAVRASMSEKGLDCLIIYGAYSATGNDTGHVNLTYLANYSSVGQTYLILPLKAEPTLIINIFLQYGVHHGVHDLRHRASQHFDDHVRADFNWAGH